jgi:hypothetical protein
MVSQQENSSVILGNPSSDYSIIGEPRYGDGLSWNYFSATCYPNCGYHGPTTSRPKLGSDGNVWEGDY